MNQAEWTDFVQKLISVLLGGIGTWLAVRVYYEKRHSETLERYAIGKQKEYAAERDFEHLKRNQEQMKEALRLLDDEIASNREDIKEIKGMLVTLFGRTGESGIFGYKEQRS